MDPSSLLPGSGLSPPSDPMCVIFLPNDGSRVISYLKPQAPFINCTDLHCYPSTHEDSPPLKIPPVAIEPQPTSDCRRKKRPPKNGLKNKKCNENAGWVDRNSNLLSVPIQRLASASNLAEEPSSPHPLPSDANLTSTFGISEVCSNAQPEPPYQHESTGGTEELLEASPTHQLYRIPEIDSMSPCLMTALNSQRSNITNRKEPVHLEEHAAAKDFVDTGIAEVPAGKTSKFNCRLPANGHREDVHHYRRCVVVSAGFVLRQKHTDWLHGIPSHPGIMEVVNLAIGSSCKEILLKGKCSQEQCALKHTIDLNLRIPHEHFGWVFNILNKWFLRNALQPDFRAVSIMLSRLSENSHDTFMIVLSYAAMISKLSNKKFSEVLITKLIEVMVKVLEFKPWEAVRALLIFIVTPETELSDILNFLSILQLTTCPTLQNHLHECVSCLWHINDSFVCPPSLLFAVLKESLAQMPVDVKLTKDRVLVDLLKQPKPLLRKEFLTVDKFLSKYYPQNSDIAHAFRTSLWYGVEAAKSTMEIDRGTYETSRVKGTGPVNPQWQYWDIQEERIKAFDLVLKKARKPQKGTNSRPRSLSDLVTECIEERRHDLFKIIASRNFWSYDSGLPSYDFGAEETNDLNCLVDALVSNEIRKVVGIMLSSFKSLKADSFRKCLQTLQQELDRCDRALVPLVVFEILDRLPGSLSDGTSAKSCFARTVNSLVVKFYREADYKSALTLMKAVRHAGVNCLDHAPEGTSQQTFTIVCSEIAFQCRLYTDAIRTLMLKNGLYFVGDYFDRSIPEHFNRLERLVVRMFRRFLKERHASLAIDTFRLVFSIQKNLHFPINIGRYYEGVVFLSFVSDLKKNACSAGDGASLYITVERICGNYQPFHSITYRSLLVELHRANSPEDVIRRVLWICVTKEMYPDFSKGPISPLVLESHLAHEEMSIYLKHFFTYFVVQNELQRLTTHPFVVKFSESPPPARKVFPVSNDIMKTSKTIPDALERLKSVLDGFSSEFYQTLDAEFSQDRVTIPIQGIEKLLHVYV